MEVRQYVSAIVLCASATVRIGVAQTLYVDVNASGPVHDGSSWCTAFLDLQVALAAATSGTVIQVAGGTYYPATAGTPNARARSFVLANGVALRGGFAGCGASNPDERNILVFETVLSGDLSRDDQPSFLNRTDNSYHVVTGAQTDSSAILDGFVVMGGFAEDAGGGVGGGLLNEPAGSPTIIRCTFVDNYASFAGGAIRNAFGSSPLVINSRFHGNSSTYGAGVGNYAESSPTFANCLFSGNTASGNGGALDNNASSSPVLINCTIVANTAFGGRAGAIWNVEAANTHIINSILWGNADSIGAGFGSQVASADDSPQPSNPFVEFSLIHGGWSGFAGPGNIYGDPKFSDFNGPDSVAGTKDDNATLLPDSPCIDRGNGALLPRDVADLDGDADHDEPISMDLRLAPRFVDTPFVPNTGQAPFVDLGAYEFHGTADFDDSGFFDLPDWVQISTCLSGPAANPTDPLCLRASFDADLDVDLADVAAFQRTFSPGNSPPSLASIGNRTAVVGSTLTIALSATDSDGDELSFTAQPLPLAPNMALNGLTGIYTFAPDESQLGSFSMTFFVSDSSLTDSETVVITVELPPPDGVTALSGRILDAQDAAKGGTTPLVGATVRLLGTTFVTTTNTAGHFLLEGIPAGDHLFEYDGSTASGVPGVSYGSYRGERAIVDHVNNVIDRPIFLPRIDPAGVAKIDPATTMVIENANIGVTLTIPPHTVKDVGGNDYTGFISVSEVPSGFTPEALPPRIQPGMIIAVEPLGLSFAHPVPVTFPNNEGFAPGNAFHVWSRDHATGQFVVVGTAEISDARTIGGRTIRTTSGGMRLTCLCGVSPPTADLEAKEDELANPCEVNIGSRATALTGNLIQEHLVAAYRSMNEPHSLRLMYNSLTADPQPIVQIEASFPRLAPIPAAVSTQLNIAGIDVGGPVFTATGGLSESIPELFLQARQFDAGDFPSGLHRFTLALTSHYPFTTVSTRLEGYVPVNNNRSSSLGAGWSIDGIDRIVDSSSGLLLVTGRGDALRFRPAPSGSALFDAPVTLAAPHGALRDVSVSDLNGDSLNDLAALFQLGNGTGVDLFWGQPDGTFLFALTLTNPPLLSGTPRDIVLHDLNNDGALDIVTGFLVRLGNGEGSFSPYTDFSPAPDDSYTPFQVVVTDTNNDGAADLLVKYSQSDQGILVLLGDSFGTFNAQPIKSLVDPNDVVDLSDIPWRVADVNNDGFVDVVMADCGHFGIDCIVTIPGKFELLTFAFGRGDGSFDVAPGAELVAPSFITLTGLASADFNSDGNIDLILSGSFDLEGNVREVSLLRGDGTGSFHNQSSALPPGSSPWWVREAADVNGDGFMDFVMEFDIDPPQGLRRQGVAIALGNGAGEFEAPTFLQFTAVDKNVVIADTNNDGANDILVPFSTTLRVRNQQPNSTGNHVSPPGDFSTLIRNPDDTFTRRLKNGTVFSFNDRGLQESVVDRNHNATTYAYDANDLLQSVTDPAGRLTAFSYSNERIKTVTDPASRVTEFEHDNAGNLTAIIDPDGSRREFSYDARHRMSSKRSRRGSATSYFYNFGGRVTRADRPDGSVGQLDPAQTYSLVNPSLGFGSASNPAPLVRPSDPVAVFRNGNLDVTTMKLGGCGCLTSAADALNRVTNITRDANHNPTAVITPSGIRTNMSYDGRGNLLQINEAVGTPETRTSRYEYDSPFNLVTKIIDPDNNEIALERDTNGNLTSITGPAPFNFTASRTYFGNGLVHTSTDENNHTYTFEYDAFGNLARLTDPFGVVTIYERDEAGNVETIVEAEGTLAERTSHFTYDEINRVTSYTDGEAATVMFFYDAEGNLAETHSPTGEVLRRFYDALNRLERIEHPIQGTTTFAYDTHGNLLAQIDGRLNLTSFQYDAANQLERITDGIGGHTDYTYDAEGNVTSVRDARMQTTTFDYDKLGRRTLMRNPLNQTTEYVYDSRDNLTEQHNPNGQVIHNSYDQLNRLSRTVTPDNVIDYTYDAVGNILTITDNDTALRYTYDLLDRVKTAETLPAGIQPVVTLTYDYDEVGNRRSVTDSLGELTGYGFDDAGRMTSVSAFGETISLGYDPAGRPTLIDRPNGVITSYGYYPSGRLLSIRHTRNDVDLFAFTYTHNAIGHIQSIQRLDGTDSFVYDALNRLTDATKNGQIEFYRYDAVGNRTQSHLSAFHDHDTANRLREDDSFEYEYDLNGNLRTKTDLVTDETTTYSWDAQGRLTRIDVPDATFASYRYDGIGRRVEKNVDGNIIRYLYDRDAIIAQVTSGGALLARYVHGPRVDQPLASQIAGQQYFYHADHLGSVVGLTHPSGMIVNGYSYDSFGRPTADPAAVANPFAFTGREWDAESGLFYYRARYYDPAAGRFLREDPLRFAAGGKNLYHYVLNNPQNATDPTGLITFWDAVDVGFFADSLGRFSACPTFGNGAFLALDTISLLPVIPSLGWITRADDVIDAVRSADRLRDAERSTSLYRAVTHAELEDIAANQVFRNPYGNEVKYFATTAEGAASYAKQAQRIERIREPYTIVESRIPTGAISPEMRQLLDGIDSVVVPTEKLGLFEQPSVWTHSPFP